jgi:HAD superfamily hydrolase (TIGR01509 family)
MKNIEAVFLDLGNVLAFHDDHVLFERMSDWGGAAPDVIRERMLVLWDAINRGTLAGDDLRRAVCRVAGSDVPMAAEPFFEMWNCHFRINQAILPMVEALFEKVRVWLLSNTNELHWRFIRPKIPQFDRFAGMVISCDLLLAKPDPEIYQFALKEAGVVAEQAAYFDDVPRFIEAACAQGIQGRVYTDTETFRSQLSGLGLVV